MLFVCFVVYLTTRFQYFRLYTTDYIDFYSILIRLPSSSEAGETRVRNMTAEFCRRVPIVEYYCSLCTSPYCFNQQHILFSAKLRWSSSGFLQGVYHIQLSSWRRHVPLKCWYTTRRLYGTRMQNAMKPQSIQCFAVDVWLRNICHLVLVCHSFSLSSSHYSNKVSSFISHL
jgi:hypothetical protein